MDELCLLMLSNTVPVILKHATWDCLPTLQSPFHYIILSPPLLRMLWMVDCCYTAFIVEKRIWRSASSSSSYISHIIEILLLLYQELFWVVLTVQYYFSSQYKKCEKGAVIKNFPLITPSLCLRCWFWGIVSLFYA